MWSLNTTSSLIISSNTNANISYLQIIHSQMQTNQERTHMMNMNIKNCVTLQAIIGPQLGASRTVRALPLGMFLEAFFWQVVDKATVHPAQKRTEDILKIVY